MIHKLACCILIGSVHGMIPDFRFLLVGPANVGKTSIMKRINHDDHDPEEYSTIGPESVTIPVRVNQHECRRVQLWDTPRDLHGWSMADSFRGVRDSTDALFLIFDMADKESLHEIPQYLEHFGSKDPKQLKILVGNKYDEITSDFIFPDFVWLQNQNSRAFGIVTGIEWRTRKTIIHKNHRRRKLGLMSMDRQTVWRVFDFLKEPENYHRDSYRIGDHKYVHPDIAREYAASIGAIYYPVSARTGRGIVDLFTDTTQRLVLPEESCNLSHNKNNFVFDEFAENLMENVSNIFKKSKPKPRSANGGRSSFSVAMDVVSDNTIGLFK